MAAAKSTAKSTAQPTVKIFDAVLERTSDRLRWVIARVPIDVHKVWTKRGQLRIQGEINGFNFSSTLFPTRRGEHFLIVNKKMQAGAKTAPGLTARFRLVPDTVPRPTAAPPKELLLVLKQSRRLLTFYESLPSSWRNDIARRISQGKHEETRRRRAQQMAERLLETWKLSAICRRCWPWPFARTPRPGLRGRRCRPRSGAGISCPFFITAIRNHARAALPNGWTKLPVRLRSAAGKHARRIGSSNKTGSSCAPREFACRYSADCAAIAMPASSAAAMIFSPSKSRHLPASTARQVAPACCMVSIGCNPSTGTSK